MPALETPAEAYSELVADSVAFSRQEHQFFVDVKAELIRQLLNERLGDLDHARVLDLGCGIGMSHGTFVPAVRTLFGVDVELDCLRIAHDRHSTVHHVEFDGLRLPFADGTLAAVFATCVFHHVPPREWSTLVAEARRVLSPGGVMVIAEHNPWNPLTRLTVWRCAFDVGVTLLSSGRTAKLLSSSGFRSLDTHFTLLFPFRARVFRMIEHAFRRFPIGAQYVAIGTKPQSAERLEVSLG